MSDRVFKAPGAAHGGDGKAGMDADGAARAAKARRNAWLLGGLAAFFYLGYIAWMFVRGAGN